MKNLKYEKADIVEKEVLKLLPEEFKKIYSLGIFHKDNNIKLLKWIANELNWDEYECTLCGEYECHLTCSEGVELKNKLGGF